MGMTFFMQAVRPSPSGGLVHLEGPGTKYAIRSNTLFDVLDRIEDRKRVGGLQRSLFRWYQKSYDYNYGKKPEAGDCHRPKEVLASLQGIERELQKNSAKYPFEWTFWLPGPDGKQEAHGTVSAWYRTRPCRLFGDDKGAWAVVTDSKDTYPLHFELTELPEVVVMLEPNGPDVTVRIEGKSFLVVHGDMLQHLKRVCLTAIQNNALLFTSIG